MTSSFPLWLGVGSLIGPWTRVWALILWKKMVGLTPSISLPITRPRSLSAAASVGDDG